VPPIVPIPPPDPLAACRRDPANVPALPSEPDGRVGTTFHTCGARILNANGDPVQITGISWFGMEDGSGAPHGLWTRNWKALLDQIAALGFNTIRLPFSNDALTPAKMPQGINYDLNPDLSGKTSLEVMDTLIAGARDRGLKIILDRHRPTSEAQSELWYTDVVSEQRWINDWVMLAQRYRGQSAVLGVDLHNEPRGPATWGSNDPATDWRLAAERAGNAVLDVNPYLLVFVQGIQWHAGESYWWGGALQGARGNPVRLKVPGRLVYSPHDYGPGVYPQPWFYAPDFPDNLPGIWEAHWAYLAKDQLAPVVLGEFGGRSVGTDAEGVWQRALVRYAEDIDAGWLNWSFNPDSSDTGGLLDYDWLTVVEDKAQLFRGHLATPLDVGSSGVFGQGRTRLVVRARSTSQAERTNNIGFTVQIANDGPVPVALSELELRYWFRPGQLGTRTQHIDLDYVAVGRENVAATIRPTDPDGMAFLQVRFEERAGSVKPYMSSGDIAVRVHKSDWTDYDQRGDYSFKPGDKLAETDRIGLYRNGQLVWGTEPPRRTPVPSPGPSRSPSPSPSPDTSR
jgi:endoglucanase